jgi:hypothetical protein
MSTSNLEDALDITASTLYVLNRMVETMSPREEEMKLQLDAGICDPYTVRLFRLMRSHVKMGNEILEELRKRYPRVEKELAELEAMEVLQ